MKYTRSQIKEIIKEELSTYLAEVGRDLTQHFRTLDAYLNSLSNNHWGDTSGATMSVKAIQNAHADNEDVKYYTMRLLQFLNDYKDKQGKDDNAGQAAGFFRQLYSRIPRPDKQVSEVYDEEEFATAAGMQQDIRSREERGDFEKGDWGVHGDTGSGEYSGSGFRSTYSSYGDYPWVAQALEDLRDEDYDSKIMAVSALVDELGVSVNDLGTGEELS
tara:strand:- start:3133 stop:3783 length:651 start_codon:yes stop_codon:yes gene_type:complete